MHQINPCFLESTNRERIVMYTCVGVNLLVIAFCAAWLLLKWHTVDLSLMGVAVALLVGYFFADIASGLVHWATDTWFHEEQFGRAIAIAREHHIHPQHILGYGFLENATLGSAPSALVIGPIATLTALLPESSFTAGFMIVFLVISVCLFFGTSIHNLGHRHGALALTRLAQRWHLLMSPKHHSVHHRGDQTVRYCTVNGWANYLLDRVHFWRWLERCIQQATGAIPREDDVAWKRRYRETKSIARSRY